MDDAAARSIVLRTDLTDFFRERILEAMSAQRVNAADDVVAYLVNVLREFARLDAPGDGTLSPSLAEMLLSTRTADPSKRVRKLKRLGDIALYVAGFFSEHLERRLVNVNYYVGMGRVAYSSVAASIRARPISAGSWKVFEELGAKFARFVDVFMAVSVQDHSPTNSSVLRLYERWQRTGSPRAAERLRSFGLLPMRHTEPSGAIN